MNDELVMLRRQVAELEDARNRLQARCSELLDRARGLRYMVHTFREAMGLPVRYAAGPSIPDDPELVRLAVRLVVEEFCETLDAVVQQHPAQPKHQLGDIRRRLDEFVTMGTVRVDMVQAADGMADLDYVVEGLRCILGIDGQAVVGEVHAANMRKLGPDGKPLRREDGKVVKPPGWQPPDIAAVLRAQGWKAES